MPMKDIVRTRAAPEGRTRWSGSFAGENAMMLQRPTTESLRARSTGAAAAAATATPAAAPRVKRSIRSLLTPEQLNGAILRESARVDRKSGAALVLVLFRFAGSCTAPSTMRLAKTILHRIRVTDDVGWFDANHLGVLLPDTAPAGAWRLARQICDRMNKRGRRPHVTMYSYGGDPVADSDEAPKVIRQTDEDVVHEARVG